jgi:HSP20 family protein
MTASLEVVVMALIRWNPTSDLMNLHSEMDRIFNDVWQGFGVTPRGGDGQASASYLPLDIERTDDAVVVYAPVPGFTPEEVSVTVDSGVLTIEAEHRQEGERGERNWIRQERFAGRLYRQISLGDGVDGDAARASFQNGVLAVSLPLVRRPEPKRIPVTVDEAARIVDSPGETTGSS